MALFADTFHEANGVGTLSRHLAEYARERNFPFLVVHGSNKTASSQNGSFEVLELKRSFLKFRVDKNLFCDPLLVRHRDLVKEHLKRFRPDLVHITGPGEAGFLGLWVSHELRVPLVASWHTNLHEYMSRRLTRALSLGPREFTKKVSSLAEREVLRGLMRFYRTAHFALAPNQTLIDLLRATTGRPVFRMPHGVNLRDYRPKRTIDPEKPFCIGYVGRLTTEKNVRVFPELERQLIAAGESNFEFLVVGEGGQRNWLSRKLRNAELPGVLRGRELAAAYSRMDAFVFPSLTDTFGLVILEAMASGLPVILTPETGARVGIEHEVTGFLSEDFASDVVRLMHDRELGMSIGKAARQFASGYSWDIVFEDLYQIYQKGLAIEDSRRELKEQQRLKAVGL